MHRPPSTNTSYLWELLIPSTFPNSLKSLGFSPLRSHILMTWSSLLLYSLNCPSYYKALIWESWAVSSSIPLLAFSKIILPSIVPKYNFPITFRTLVIQTLLQIYFFMYFCPSFLISSIFGKLNFNSFKDYWILKAKSCFCLMLLIYFSWSINFGGVLHQELIEESSTPLSIYPWQMN